MKEVGSISHEEMVGLKILNFTDLLAQ